MPKSGLNVALKGLDDIFSTEESRQEEQRYNRFPSANFSRSKTTRSKFWTMIP